MDSNRRPNKYKKKKRDKKKKKKHRRSSSSSESSSEEEWVEASTSKQSSHLTDDVHKVSETTSTAKSNENDEWVSFSEEFRTVTRDQIKEKKKPKDDDKKSILDRPGQSERELNPYWKDGGTGLPSEVKDLHVTESAIGDYGLDWLRRALRRAKEQASEEGRSLENVVSERWGSLETLQSMIKDAEKRTETHKKPWRNIDSDKKKDYSRRNEQEKYHSERDKSDRHDHLENYSWKVQESNKKRSFMKPNDNDSDDRYKHKDYKSSKEMQQKERQYSSRNDNREYRALKDEDLKKRFTKPSSDDDDYEKRQSSSNTSRYSSQSGSGKGWRKQPPKEYKRTSSEDEERQSSMSSRYSSQAGSEKNWKKQSSKEIKKEERMGNQIPAVENRSSDSEQSVNAMDTVESTKPPETPLTADERNELAAKLVKAEIMGNLELVKELKSRLEQAREAAAAPEKVILTHTDAKGFTQPLSLVGGVRGGHGQKREKVQTHDGGKRVRYFADDDRFTLQDMFEREKRSTTEDQNEVFARLASKNVGRDESARDMDDVFEEMARVQESDDKTNARARSKAIAQNKRSTQAVESCQWCLDSKHLLKHLVVAIGSKVYLCLPPYESLTEGHCLLIPTQHITCGVQSDEEVWEEMQTFRKTLVQLFLSMDMDIVFFEYAARFFRFPHMVLHCVPLPKESGDIAPIYFKKAILECETEWSSNKKLVDLAGRNVRRAVPRGLPYFAVDFGLQAGYAHVIEDESLFPNNFAQEIIGGMLDVDHSKWRKPRKEKFDDQRKKVVAFIKWWQPFDFTKTEKTVQN